ncbi:MAG: phosphoglucomutase/phosphomannomutase family protein, partial [Anaerolineales bacterium]
MVQEIKFGTDGWRGHVGEDYTFANVRRCTQGFAAYLAEEGYQDSWVVVGHDRRYQAEQFAAAVAEVLAGNGFNVYLTDRPTPTPVIAYAVVDKKAAAAINVTSSHNPYTDNGFKVRDKNGGAIDPEGLTRIEKKIPDTEEETNRIPLDEALANGKVKFFDAAPAYIEHLKTLIDLQPIKDAGLRILVDPMWGNG